MVYFLIACSDKGYTMFWGGQLGWCNLEDATVYTEQDLHSTKVPQDGYWLKVSAEGVTKHYPSMDFSEALKHLREGRTLKRRAWIKFYYCVLTHDSQGNLIITNAVLTSDDILATDWYIV